MLLVLTSCENYIDVNGSQTNRAEFDALTPSQMLAGAISNYTYYQNITLGNYGNRISYVWGLNTGYTTTDAAYNYKYSSNDYSTCFTTGYLYADNFQDILDKKTQYPDYSYHFGIAKVFKVMFMDYATALYGDVPYTEAFNSNISSPKYDDDKTIIPKLFVELDEAKAYFNSPSVNVKALGKEDIVFKGDITRWKRLINTIDLKLAMRLSKTTDATLVALRNARMAALNVSKDFIVADVAVNPGYNNSILLQRTPIFRAYGRNEAFNGYLSAYSSNAAGDFAARLVNGTMNDANITTGTADPRRSRMFTLVGGVVVGNVQGIFPLVAISRFSTFFSGRTGADVASADKNAGERDAYLMQVAESKFLQAEAYQRGYLTGGTAQQSFNDGVTASFAFYSKLFGSLTTSNFAVLDAAAYLTSIDAKNGLGWTGSTNKISAIMTQKYLALAEWNGIELYIDNMRTGFPVLPLPFGVTETKRPNRLIYPPSEYSSNSANTPSVLNTDLFTVNTKTPYYLQ